MASIFEPQVVSTPSVQNTSLCASGMPVSGPALPAAMRCVGRARGGERALAVDGDEGVERGVQRVDAVEEQAREFDGGDLPGVERAAQFREGSVDHFSVRQVDAAARVRSMRSGAATRREAAERIIR